MATTVTLTASKCPQIGKVYWRLDDLPDMEDEVSHSTSVVQVPHDLLEHVNGLQRIGSVFDELQAIGAIWWIRGQWGTLDPRIKQLQNPYEILGSEVETMWEKYKTELPYLGNVETWEEAEHIISNIKPYNLEGNEKSWRDYSDCAVKLLSLGMEKAQKLYPEPLEANNLFWEIVENLEYWFGKQEEGMHMRLTYGLETPVSVEVNYGELQD